MKPKSPKGPGKHRGTENLIPYKPGKSGNPKGRPLGSKSLKGAFEAVASLDFGMVKFPGGIERELTGTEKIALKIYKMAKGGDLRAADMYFDRTSGKVAQPIKNIGDGMGKVSITIKRELNDEEDPNVEVRTERVEPTEEKK